MADIIQVDYTDEAATLEAMAKMPMHVTSNTFTSTPDLTSGLTEEIGGALYIVDAGDVTPSGSLSATTMYLTLVEDGDGTATAAWISSATDAPLWNDSKNGYYMVLSPTKKAIGVALYDGVSSYTFYRYTNHNKTYISKQYSNDIYNSNDVEICNDLEVGNDVNIGGTITCDEHIDTNLQCSATTTFLLGASTGNDLYNFIDGELNEFGVVVAANGVYNVGGTSTTITAVTKTSGTPNTATFYYIDPTSGSSSSISKDQGGGVMTGTGFITIRI